MATSDPVGLALASLGAGASSGATVLTAGLLALRTVQRAGGDPDAGFTVLTVFTFLGIVVAVACGAGLARALDDIWRRGVIGALSVFGTALLAGLAVPADMLWGRVGLAGYFAALLAAVAYTITHARRAARR